jgi:DNA-binding XRE family transcriptional regulator
MTTILKNQQVYARALRESCKLTQAELANLLGHTQSTIHRWERVGAIPAASLAALEDLERSYRAKSVRTGPSLRVAAAELAIAVKKGRAEMFDLADRVLGIVKGKRKH